MEKENSEIKENQIKTEATEPKETKESTIQSNTKVDEKLRNSTKVENTNKKLKNEGEENKEEKSNKNFKAKYFIKVKRGAFWSERIVVLNENLIQYFKSEGEKRFEEKLITCNLEKEENSKDPLKHLIVLTSKKDAFEDVKLMNSDKNFEKKNGKVTKTRAGLEEFIFDFNDLTKRIIGEKAKLRNTINETKEKEKIEKVMKEKENENEKSVKDENVKSITQSSQIESIPLTTESVILHKEETIDSNANANDGADATQEADYTDISLKAEKKPSHQNQNKVFCMKVEKVVNDSIKIPLTEILKTLVNEPEEEFKYVNNVRISSNHSLNDLNYFTTIVENYNKPIVEKHNEECLELLAEQQNETRNIFIISFLCFLYLLIFQLDFSNNELGEESHTNPSFSSITEKGNFLMSNHLKLIFLLVAFIFSFISLFIFRGKTREELESKQFMYKPVYSSIDSNSVIKLTSFINENFKDTIEFFSNSKYSKEYLKNLDNISIGETEKDGLEYSFTENSSKISYIDGKSVMKSLFGEKEKNKDSKLNFKVKRLALKRKDLFIIGEFAGNNLLKLTCVESAGEGVEFCKVSVFIPLRTVIKNELSEVILNSLIDSLDLVLNFFQNKNFNETISSPGVLEMNNFFLNRGLKSSSK